MIVTDPRGEIAVLTIERHEKRNALDVEHLEQLGSALNACVAAGARAVVITGSGSSFCAGADLDGVYSTKFRTALYDTLDRLMTVPIPVVAAVNGPAIGAGTQLAIACDLRIVAPEAVFAVPTARNGLAVDPWTIRRLALLAGGATAGALLLACETVGAERAVDRGLADRLGSFGDAIELAEQIATYAPLSLSYSKRALGSVLEPGGWDSILEAEFEKCWSSEDLVEGQLARTERRQPKFSGK